MLNQVRLTVSPTTQMQYASQKASFLFMSLVLFHYDPIIYKEVEKTFSFLCVELFLVYQQHLPLFNFHDIYGKLISYPPLRYITLDFDYIAYWLGFPTFVVSLGFPLCFILIFLRDPEIAWNWIIGTGPSPEALGFSCFSFQDANRYLFTERGALGTQKHFLLRWFVVVGW